MFDKIKNHLKKRKQVYIGAAIGAGVATIVFVTWVLVRKNTVVDATAINIGYKNTIEQTIEVYIEALGDPGNIIQDTTTGTIYASQGQACRELGIDPAKMSKHVRGRKPDIDGRVFKKLGKAIVPSESQE